VPKSNTTTPHVPCVHASSKLYLVLCVPYVGWRRLLIEVEMKKARNPARNRFLVTNNPRETENSIAFDELVWLIIRNNTK
jgi:hypothetical protein